MTLTSAKVRVNIQSILSGALDLSVNQDNFNQNFENAFTNGAGASKAEEVWHDQRTLGSGANEDIDVAGALTGVLGGTVTFTKIKAILIRSLSTNTVNLTVSRPASNGLPLFAAAGDAVVLTPGAIFLLTDPSAAGIAVTAGTADLINLLAGAASTVYDIWILGEV